jgi:hypothetical protein
MGEMFAGIVAPHRDRSKPAKGLPLAGGSQGMQFNGGNVIECAYVYPVFVGTKWQDNQTWVALAADLQLFMNDVFSSSYVSTLKQYGFLAARRRARISRGRRPARLWTILRWRRSSPI